MNMPMKVGQGATISMQHVPACPVCTSTNTVTLCRLTATRVAAFLCPPSKDPDRNQRMANAIRALWQGENGTIQRCSCCGFGFGHPFVGGDENFYSILHEQHAYPSWRWDYDVALTYAQDGGRAIDIGAGRGFFLKGLSATWERHAVESTPTMRDHLRSDGIAVYEHVTEAPNAGFHLVTLFQVLEHIADFRSVLMECRRVLAPGGLLVITVPDGDAMIAQELVTGAPDVPPNHVAKWTPSTLGRVLAEQGLLVQNMEAEPRALRHAKGAMHLKVMADAVRRGTLASSAYGIRNRTLRIAALGLVALVTGLPMLRHWRFLTSGGAFAAVAKRTES